MCRVEIGEYDAAIEDFDRATKLDPDHPYVAQQRAAAMERAKGNGEENDAR